ncbi:Hypothetical protein A7982_08073 [Minicystis rosea]|nr:Hypothetical protein A7982_08073 [Minicystis rosea]
MNGRLSRTSPRAERVAEAYFASAAAAGAAGAVLRRDLGP